MLNNRRNSVERVPFLSAQVNLSSSSSAAADSNGMGMIANDIERDPSSVASNSSASSRMIDAVASSLPALPHRNHNHNNGSMRTSSSSLVIREETINPRACLCVFCSLCLLLIALLVFFAAQWMITFSSSNSICDCNASLWMSVHLFQPFLGPLLYVLIKSIILDNLDFHTNDVRIRYENDLRRLLFSEHLHRRLHYAWLIYGCFEWMFKCHQCSKTSRPLYWIFTITLMISCLERIMFILLWMMPHRYQMNHRDLRSWIINHIASLVLTQRGQSLIHGLDMTNSFDIETGMTRLRNGQSNQAVIDELEIHHFMGDEHDDHHHCDESDDKHSDDHHHPRGEECSICLEWFHREDEIITLPHCLHTFHKECITQWLLSRTSCPICRSDVAQSVQRERQQSSV